MKNSSIICLLATLIALTVQASARGCGCNKFDINHNWKEVVSEMEISQSNSEEVSHPCSSEEEHTTSIKTTQKPTQPYDSESSESSEVSCETSKPITISPCEAPTTTTQKTKPEKPKKIVYVYKQPPIVVRPKPTSVVINSKPIYVQPPPLIVHQKQKECNPVLKYSPPNIKISPKIVQVKRKKLTTITSTTPSTTTTTPCPTATKKKPKPCQKCMQKKTTVKPCGCRKHKDRNVYYNKSVYKPSKSEHIINFKDTKCPEESLA